MSKKVVAVIGCGMSGLACTKALVDEDIIPITFEMKSHIGGLWHYDPDPLAHSVYLNLKTNSLRDNTAFHDFPMNPEYPNYPHHTQVLKYFLDYAEHFGLYEYIKFNHKVIKVQPMHTDSDTMWKITVHHNYSVLEYEVNAIAVCNGHHWCPIFPTPEDIPGMNQFTGQQIHSSNYRNSELFTNKRVLVAGLGLSGNDLFKELIPVASKLVGSSRRQLPQPPNNNSNPSNLFSEVFPPTFPRDPPEQKPTIKEISGSTIIFSDDSTFSNVDIIIWCWGFKYNFPFLDGLVEVLSNPSRVCLFEHVFPVSIPGIAFIGLPALNNSLHPIAEKQAIWFAMVCSGKTKLPDKETMAKSVQEWANSNADNRVMYRPIQVSFHDYPKKIDELIETYKQQ